MVLYNYIHVRIDMLCLHALSRWCTERHNFLIAAGNVVAIPVDVQRMTADVTLSDVTESEAAKDPIIRRHLSLNDHISLASGLETVPCL